MWYWLVEKLVRHGVVVQVRCMVAVLVMVGQGLEEPGVVQQLLDVGTVDRKPQYNMAPEVLLFSLFMPTRTAQALFCLQASSSRSETVLQYSRPLCDLVTAPQ